MKAIILASGIGKRLQPQTNTIPKPLLKLDNKTILGYQLDHLIFCGISRIIITTGPFEAQIKNFVQQHYPHLDVTYVHNPKYSTTNYIYSLWLTKDFIDDDIILIHGDLVFSSSLLQHIIKQKGNAVLVNKTIPAPEKDFKAVIINKRVTKIGVNFSGPKAFFALPLYRFIKSDFQKWMQAIDKEIQQNHVQLYAEDTFNKISDTILLHPLFFSTDFAMEIDTIDDLQKAQTYFQDKKVTTKEQELLKALITIADLFKKNDITAWLDTGTLLGAIRHKGFIPWDYDVDLGAWYDMHPKIQALFPMIRDLGFDVCYFPDEQLIKFLSVDCEIDINYYLRKNEYATRTWYIQNKIGKILDALRWIFSIKHIELKQSKIPIGFAKKFSKIVHSIPLNIRKKILCFIVIIFQRIGCAPYDVVIPNHFFSSLLTLDFYGHTFNIPSDTEQYLELRYGKNWRIPKKDYIYYRDDGSCTKRI